jgi:hypothetical protein
MRLTFRRACSVWRRLADDERGAAVAEFALSTVLMIPLIFYVVFSGEVYLTAIKAQEAEIAAGWNVTGYRLHNLRGGDYRGLYSAAASRSATTVKNGLRELDSYRDSGGPAFLNTPSIDDVTCRFVSGAPVAIAPGPAQLHNDGVIRCQAQTTFRPNFKFMPKRIMEGPLFARLSQMQFCGLGDSLQGCSPATHGFTLLTDDWGMENGRANPPEQFNSSNLDFYTPGAAIYGGGIGSSVIAAVMGPITGGGDYTMTSTFKLGYTERVDKPRDLPAYKVDMTQAKLTTYVESVYNQRGDGRYMGNGTNSP